MLAADAGGIGLAWDDAKDLWAEGGRAVITANENAADAIKLHADAGGSQTITLLNDEGTAVAENASAIQLRAAAGGISLNAGVSNDEALKIITDQGGGLMRMAAGKKMAFQKADETEMASISGGGVVSGSATMKAFGYAMEGTNSDNTQKLFTLAVVGGILTVTESAL